MEQFAVPVANIALTFEDGSCRVMSFQLEGRGHSLPFGATWKNEARAVWQRQATSENKSQNLRQAFPPRDLDGKALMQVVNARVMEKGEDPLKDPVFMGARVDRDGKVSYDIEKARDCLRAQIRRERLPVLADLDVQFMRAIETGADVSEVSAAKVELRDITDDPRIDAAQTVDELKLLTLSALTPEAVAKAG